MKLVILNSDPKECTYGGVAPIMRNMHPFLSKAYEVEYCYTPASWDRVPGPHRLKTLLYVLSRRKMLQKADFILSHIPEGSFVASLTDTPYAHIYHGNTNPMEVSRFKLGKLFSSVYKLFFKRIEKTAAVTYTVGPVFGSTKKMWNPINHNVKVKRIEERSGFIFAGRLESPKNIDRIIRIYSSLPEDIIRQNDLYIAGTGSQEKRLKQIADDEGCREHIHFLGSLDNRDLIEEESCRLLMLMASDYEGMPTAIAEALSVGVPVVTTAAGDIPSIIQDGSNGLLLSLDCSDDEYKQAIIKALSNIGYMSRQAFESSKIFDAEVIVGSIISDIDDILRKRYPSNC